MTGSVGASSEYAPRLVGAADAGGKRTRPAAAVGALQEALRGSHGFVQDDSGDVLGASSSAATAPKKRFLGRMVRSSAPAPAAAAATADAAARPPAHNFT